MCTYDVSLLISIVALGVASWGWFRFYTDYNVKRKELFAQFLYHSKKAIDALNSMYTNFEGNYNKDNYEYLLKLETDYYSHRDNMEKIHIQLVATYKKFRKQKDNFNELFELMKESKVLLLRIHNVLRGIRKGDFWDECKNKIEGTVTKYQELKETLF
jgi:hypothetical protein